MQLIKMLENIAQTIYAGLMFIAVATLYLAVISGVMMGLLYFLRFAYRFITG